VKVVLVDGWTRQSGAPGDDIHVGLNMNASLGPAPAGYLRMRGVEVFITPEELRQLWDAWAELHLPPGWP
jgi:hypothetical protein